MIFSKIWLAKIFITSCFTISQRYLTYRTSQKKALGIWTYHSKSTIWGYIQYLLIWDELSRGVLTKYFSKSSHHAEHFSYLSFYIKMNTYEGTGIWNLIKKTWFLAQISQHFYFRVSGIDSKCRPNEWDYLGHFLIYVYSLKDASEGGRVKSSLES